MADYQSEKEPVGLLVRRIPPIDIPAEQLPADFVPLRLLMRPGGLCLELRKPDVVIGRHSKSDMRLPLPDVSRRHCRLHFTNSHWEISDLGSLNGIRINGEKLQHAVLQAGDAIRIGGLTFVVELPLISAGTLAAAQQQEDPKVIWQSIAKVLPSSHPDATEEYRKAS